MELKEQKSNYEEKILEELDTDTIPEVAKRENRIANFFDNRVEPYMWNAKFFIILAIMCSLIVSIGLILYGVYETIGVLQLLFKSQDPKEIELATLSIVDIFLFGMVMMIFAFGTYNLFISKLDNVSRDTRSYEVRPKWVRVENFGELKSIFIKVAIMILIITFLELVVRSMELFQKDIYSILIIPVGILLIALSLKLVHSSKKEL